MVDERTLSMGSVLDAHKYMGELMIDSLTTARNKETFIHEFLENHEEMFLLYSLHVMHVACLNPLHYTLLCYPS